MELECVAITEPPADNMGVEIQKTGTGLSWHVDYLTVTVWDMELLSLMNKEYPDLGLLQDQNHGGRFYEDMFRNELGVVLRTNPVSGTDYRSTLEIPGTACQILGYERLQLLIQSLMRGATKVSINRIDIAIDNPGFSVGDLAADVIAGRCRSLFKRESICQYNKPFEVAEDGSIGTSGITIGARSSGRYLRCYDKHGFTRLEMEYKDGKANQVGIDILYADGIEDAFRLAIGHLRDYIDIFSEYWTRFVGNVSRLYKHLAKTAREISFEKIRAWMLKQVSANYYMAKTMADYDFAHELIAEGYEKTRKHPERYKTRMNYCLTNA